MRTLILILFFLLENTSFGAGIFDGANTFYGTKDTTIYDAVATSQKITLSCRIVRVAGNAGADIFAKGFEYNNSVGLWDIQYSGGSGGLDFVYGNGTAHLWRSTDVIAANQLLRVVTTFTYGTGASFIMSTNGVSLAGSWVAGDGSQLAISQTEQVFMGAAGFTPIIYWNGRGSDFAVWSKILTSIELTTLQKSNLKRIEIQIQPASLLGFWPCDENNSIIVDWSRNRNNSCCAYRGGGSTPPPNTDGIERILSYPPME